MVDEMPKHIASGLKYLAAVRLKEQGKSQQYIAEAYSKSRSLFCLLIKKERNYIYRLSISQFRSFHKLFISSSSLNCTHRHDAVILCNSNLLLYQ